MSSLTTSHLPLSTRDLGPDVLDRDGRPKIMPAGFYRATTPVERQMLCLKNGLYCLPTIELIQWLHAYIAGRRALEIGAGNGSICRALRIRGSDSFMQDRPEIQAHYASIGQPTVRYSRQLERVGANEAVRRFKPEVVISAWVTHKYRDDRPEADGNAFGVDEEDIIANCDAYVFIGNRHTHRQKSIWSLPHTIIEPPWLFSRASTGDPEFLAVWERAKL